MYLIYFHHKVLGMIEHYDGGREYNEGNANPMNSGPETTVLNSPSCEIAPSPCRRGKSASQVSGNNRIVATVTSKAQSHPTNVASESFFISCQNIRLTKPTSTTPYLLAIYISLYRLRCGHRQFHWSYGQ